MLSYSGLGFGKTTCKITLDDPDWDGKAGRQMVDVLAGKRAYTPAGGSAPADTARRSRPSPPGDPRVGMIGGSYGGQIQYAVASQDPRIDAIIPIITWNDLTYSLAPGNVAKKQWIDLFFGAGILSGAENASADPETLAGCPNFTDQACVGAAQLNTLGYPDAGTVALAKHASVASYVKRVKVPTLLVQGQKDTLFNLNEAVATYDALRAQGTPVKMIWQSWGHSGSSPVPGELDFDASSLRDSYLGSRFLDWMNHYVRGTSSAPTGPQFAYFRDWVPYDTDPSVAGQEDRRGLRHQQHGVLEAHAHPLLHRQRRPHAHPFRGTARIGVLRQRRTRPDVVLRDLGPRGRHRSNNPPTDAPGTFAGFTSPVLRAPAEVVGAPVVTLRLSAPAAAATQAGGPSGQLVLFAKVYDVAPDGSKVLKNRLIAPQRVADVTKPVTVRLPGIVHRFATGHRIQLVVAASDFAYAGNTAAAAGHDQHQPGRADHPGPAADQRAGLLTGVPEGVAQHRSKVPQSAKCSCTQPVISPVVAPGVKIFATPSSVEGRHVLLRDDAAAEDDDVGGVALLEQLDQLAEERHVGPGEDGEPDQRRRPPGWPSPRSARASGAARCR